MIINDKVWGNIEVEERYECIVNSTEVRSFSKGWAEVTSLLSVDGTVTFTEKSCSYKELDTENTIL